MSAGIIFPSRPQVAFLAFQFPQVDVVPRSELSWVTWDDAFFGEVVVVQVIDLFPLATVGHPLSGGRLWPPFWCCCRGMSVSYSCGRRFAPL